MAASPYFCTELSCPAGTGQSQLEIVTVGESLIPRETPATVVANMLPSQHSVAVLWTGKPCGRRLAGFAPAPCVMKTELPKLTHRHLAGKSNVARQPVLGGFLAISAQAGQQYSEGSGATSGSFCHIKTGHVIRPVLLWWQAAHSKRFTMSYLLCVVPGCIYSAANNVTPINCC